MGLSSAQEVLVLTEKNFKETLEKNPDGLLVEFYAPWCGHCKQLEPKWNQAAEMLHEQKITIPLGKVDATVESSLASEHGVQGYPTLKWFVGGTPTEYDGPREAAGIVDWIKSMTGAAVVEGAPVDTDKLSITLTADSLLEDFENVAKKNRKKGKWYFVKGAGPKIVLKHKGEPAIEGTDVSKAGIEKLASSNAFPLYGMLDGESFGEYMKAEKGMLWTLLPMTAETKDKVVEETRATMTEVAEKLSGELYVSWTDTNEFAKIIDSMFGVTEFPKIVVQKKMGDKKNFIYSGEHTTEKIMEYVKKVQSGEIQPVLKSEAVPAEPQTDPVKIMVGKNLEEMLFQKDKDVLLEVYAPWCGHCKKLDPEWTKVGKKIQKEGFEEFLVMAKMDGTANDSPVDSVEWSGFPTIVFVKAGTKDVVKYDGGRDAKGIWKWLKKNSSFADKIKAAISAKTEKKEEL